ncbi:MFS transporter [Endozoicomonas sp. Mp262]|uniref:MFS transporter n=1 Tax=Endozoicomonas sp. Mp262 TaxID=2919499 RepID=UPI0021D91108
MTKSLTERRLIPLIVLTQFITTLDFIMVMPMGPDITTSLGIPLSQVGLFSTAYALSAAITLILLSAKLDHFDRRKALVVSIMGLSLAAFAASVSSGLYSLIITRIIAGLFGGLTSSFAMALVIDTIPPARRGRAMGKIAGAFSLAAILGVPAGLQISLWYNWQFAFQVLGLLGIFASGLLWLYIPKQTANNSNKQPGPSKRISLTNEMVLGLGCVTAGIVSGFLLIPHLAGYLQYNLDYDRELVGSLYMAGGVITYLLTWFTGHMIDRFGSVIASGIGIIGFVTAIVTLFIAPGIVSIPVVFTVFMGFNAIRTVSTQTLMMQIPAPSQRAGFMALQNATRHISTGVAAAIASVILTQQSTGVLGNTSFLGWLAITIATALPILVWLLTLKLKDRNQTTINAQTA